MHISPGSRGGRRRAVSFPRGTLMLFQQTAAPVGWTKQTTHNDKALRVVSGTASSGGSVAFSTVFGKTATDAHTLTIAEMPVHQHTITGEARSYGPADGNNSQSGSFAGITHTNDAGGGGSHTHPMDIRVAYVDLIIASKD
jgi:microcystin-dependent protein